jgi:RNA polymerase sigma-70 factor, ECF subfamily
LNTDSEVFSRHRKRLIGIAYRMLGSRAEAEDIVQDAYIRWHDRKPDTLVSAEAWLVTVTTRLCIDRLRSRKLEMQTYIGPWLPEPVSGVDFVTPESTLVFAGDVSMAFLVVLEQLAPEERAAFLLREVFDYGYDEVAAAIARNETACRQIVHRARKRVLDDAPRFEVDAATHRHLLRKFIAAASTGNKAAIVELLTADASMTSDGGGKATSVLKVLHGAERIARLYVAVAKSRPDLVWRPGMVNGEPGVLRYGNGELHSTMSLVSDGTKISAIYSVMNPDKLTRFAAGATAT